MQKYNIAVANKNCKHEVSLKAYILMNKFIEYPICRTEFNPEIYNILNEKRKEHKTVKSIKQHYFKFLNIISKKNMLFLLQ